MLVENLVGTILLLSILTVATGIGWFVNDRLMQLISIILGVICCTLLYLLVCSAMMMWQIQRQFTLRPYLVDKVQCVSYDDTVVNLNKVFGRTISADEFVQVTEYKSGPYKGLYYRTEPKLEITAKKED